MLSGDDRGQSVQVGAILLFAALVIIFSTFQAVVVPQENKEVEFDDYLAASADMTDLRDAIREAASRDAVRGVTVRTGTRYPARALFVNPPPPTGSVRTSDPATVRLANVTATGGAPANVRAYWNGSPHTLDTRLVAFRPAYNHVDAGRVGVEYGFTYRDYGPNRTVPLATQTLVDGNRITIVSVAGALGASGYSASVTATPLSAQTHAVSVTGADGSPVTVTVPTNLPARAWRETVLADELDVRHPDSGYVTAVTPGPRPGTVNVTFEADATYELRLALVELAATGSAGGVARPGPAYVVPVGGQSVAATVGTPVSLSAEVRDAYNNPVSNVDVTFDAPAGAFESSGDTTVTVSTDATGTATASYVPASTGSVNVTAAYGDEPLERTTFTLDADSVAAGDGSINPNATARVVLADEYAINNTDVRMTFDNRGSQTREIDEARISFYYSSRPDKEPSTATFVDPPRSPSLAVGGSLRTLDEPVAIPPAGSSVTLRFDGDKFTKVYKDDFYVVTFVFDNGETATYFVAVS